ncbi:MAG: hypothetical protein DLM67_16225 [Candidatus Nephthysia bennettiae]|nr:MAG: hypothetical protein DLM67_16225 [Candidatus Dormibacteraeota bacterium]
MALRYGHLPLRYVIHGVDVIYTFDSVPISLMNRIYAQKSRLAVRVGDAFAPQSQLALGVSSGN